MARGKGIVVGVLVVAVLAMAAFLSNTANVKSSASSMAANTSKQEGGSSSKKQVAAGQQAPDFTLQDLNGHKVKLSDLQGKPVILNFWASWCGPCKEEMPDLEQAYQADQDKIAIYGINLTDQDQEANARQFIKDHGITFPVLLDPNGQVNQAYHVINVPTTIAIDKNGKIQQVRAGQMTRAQMDDIIKQDLAVN